MTMIAAQPMTFEDLLAQPKDGNLHELVRGEILCMPSPKGDHGHVEALLVEAIGRYLYTSATDRGWHSGLGRTQRDRLVGTTSIVNPGGILEGESVLPGFRISLSELFD